MEVLLLIEAVEANYEFLIGALTGSKRKSWWTNNCAGVLVRLLALLLLHLCCCCFTIMWTILAIRRNITATIDKRVTVRGNVIEFYAGK